MTDITDQDLRTAREWAASIDPEMDCWSASARAVARVILATVDAPAPTLAEELLYRADLLDNGDPDGDTPQALRTLADRAEQMEQDTEDQQEWNRRITKQVATLASERDDARAEVKVLAEDLAGAESEVERLAAVNEELRRTDNYKEFREFLNVQKGAESNAETPDPADVPAGEAWLVECRGELSNAVKDRDDNNEPWNTIDANGRYVYKRNENVTLVSRLVPEPRVITNPDELDKLAEGTIVRDKDGDAWRRTCDEWTTTADYGRFTSWAASRSCPVTVLWEPEA